MKVFIDGKEWMETDYLSVYKDLTVYGDFTLYGGGSQTFDSLVHGSFKVFGVSSFGTATSPTTARTVIIQAQGTAVAHKSLQIRAPPGYLGRYLEILNGTTEANVRLSVGTTVVKMTGSFIASKGSFSRLRVDTRLYASFGSFTRILAANITGGIGTLHVASGSFTDLQVSNILRADKFLYGSVGTFTRVHIVGPLQGSFGSFTRLHVNGTAYGRRLTGSVISGVHRVSATNLIGIGSFTRAVVTGSAYIRYSYGSVGSYTRTVGAGSVKTTMVGSALRLYGSFIAKDRLGSTTFVIQPAGSAQARIAMGRNVYLGSLVDAVHMWSTGAEFRLRQSYGQVTRLWVDQAVLNVSKANFGSPFAAAMSVTPGSSNKVGLEVWGTNSQTANIFKVYRNSAGSVCMSVGTQHYLRVYGTAKLNRVAGTAYFNRSAGTLQASKMMGTVKISGVLGIGTTLQGSYQLQVAGKMSRLGSVVTHSIRIGPPGWHREYSTIDGGAALLILRGSSTRGNFIKVYGTETGFSAEVPIFSWGSGSMTLSHSSGAYWGDVDFDAMSLGVGNNATRVATMRIDSGTPQWAAKGTELAYLKHQALWVRGRTTFSEPSANKRSGSAILNICVNTADAMRIMSGTKTTWIFCDKGNYDIKGMSLGALTVMMSLGKGLGLGTGVYVHPNGISIAGNNIFAAGTLNASGYYYTNYLLGSTIIKNLTVGKQSLGTAIPAAYDSGIWQPLGTSLFAYAFGTFSGRGWLRGSLEGRFKIQTYGGSAAPGSAGYIVFPSPFAAAPHRGVSLTPKDQWWFGTPAKYGPRVKSINPGSMVAVGSPAGYVWWQATGSVF